ncbi:MAG: extracellular solute-binding protein [Candidatus Tectomicrobia bacterium]|uniref:Extracellular solute-binding protein n=1 Tax=Tectimicrobiota bacterium TaxID=2528274 RepID=A0A932GP64_UNCTE|nr:extracellular solute-binding protein [Candidatus Tectomicrobia bacterium]
MRLTRPAGRPWSRQRKKKGASASFFRVIFPQEEFGIRLDFTAEPTGPAQLRIERESAAGKNTTNILISGVTEFLDLYPKGLLAPVRPKLALADVTDSSKWREGGIKWADKAQQYMPMVSEWVHIDLMVNTRVIDPKKITSWKDLLKPEYKGKIVAQEVTVGAGGATARALLEDFGPEYLKALYKGQDLVLTRDAREVVRLMAQGSQPIALAVIPAHAEAFRKEGFPLERVFPTDGVLSVSGGSAVPKIVANAPHPNAAAVFVNWFMSKRGQEIYTAISLEPSRRTDVVVPTIPQYIIPKAKTKYRNQYEEDYYVNIAPKMRKQIEQALGR